MKYRTGLFLADIHHGSLFGVMPEDLVVRVGNAEQHLSPTNQQDQLLDRWKEMVKTVTPDFVLVNGDLCEGYNPKEKSRYLTTADLGAQVRGAVKLLRMIRGKPKFIIVEGTQYHIGSNQSLDELVAQELDASFGLDRAIDLEEGVSIHACHGVGYSSVPAYRTTAIARELMVATINADTLGKYALLVRSHVHYHVQVEYGSTMGHVLPCWKLRDPYASRKGLAMNPKIGWIVYKIYEDGVLEWDKRRSGLTDVENQIERVEI